MTAQGQEKGKSTWESLLARDAAVRQVLGKFSNTDLSPDSTAKEGIALLLQLGVTHFVYGEWEHKLYPKFSLEKASVALGMIAYRNGEHGVIRLHRP